MKNNIKTFFDFINESQEEYTVPIEANSRYQGTSVKDGKTYLLVVGKAEKLMGDVEIFDNNEKQIAVCTMRAGEYKSIPKGCWGCINDELRKKHGDFKNIKKIS